MQVERRIERLSSTRLVIDLPASFADRSVEVLVLTLDEPENDQGREGAVMPNGARFSSLARALSLTGLGEKFADPIAWQKEVRAVPDLGGRVRSLRERTLLAASAPRHVSISGIP